MTAPRKQSTAAALVGDVVLLPLYLALVVTKTFFKAIWGVLPPRAQVFVLAMVALLVVVALAQHGVIHDPGAH